MKNVLLRPCPFCGGSKLGIDNNKALIEHYDEAKEMAVAYWVFCMTCRSCGSTTETKTAAVAAWNNRVRDGGALK